MEKEFKVSDVFSVERSRNLKKELCVPGNMPYITRTAANNGVAGYCGNEENAVAGNCIIIGGESAVAFYQSEPFATGNNINVLRNDNLDESSALYICACLNAHTRLYSYSHPWNSQRIKDTVITLPVIASPDGDHLYTPDDIDWDFMRDRVKELERDRVKELERDRVKELDAYLAAAGLDDCELTDEDKRALSLASQAEGDEVGGAQDAGGLRWGEFLMGDLFDSASGTTDLKKRDINGRGLPVVSSGLANNGIIGRTDVKARVMPAGTITVDMFGNAFYRDFEYKEVTHARVFTLMPRGFALTRETGLYIVALLSWLSNAFSYANMCNFSKIADASISLPVTSSGEPDWGFMERYIRAQEKQVIAGVVAYKDRMLEETRKIVGAA